MVSPIAMPSGQPADAATAAVRAAAISSAEIVILVIAPVRREDVVGPRRRLHPPAAQAGSSATRTLATVAAAPRGDSARDLIRARVCIAHRGDQHVCFTIYCMRIRVHARGPPRALLRSTASGAGAPAPRSSDRSPRRSSLGGLRRASRDVSAAGRVRGQQQLLVRSVPAGAGRQGDLAKCGRVGRQQSGI